jgi:hypothetical protein
MQWRWVGGQPVVVSCKGGVGVAVGWRVGGVGRVEGVSVDGWSLRALNAAARWALRVEVGDFSRLRRARAAFLNWVTMPRRRAMLTSCLTDSVYLEALQLYRLMVGRELALASLTISRMECLAWSPSAPQVSAPKALNA